MQCSSTSLWQLDLSPAAQGKALQLSVALAVFTPQGQRGQILGATEPLRVISVRDRAHLPAARGKAAMGRGHSREWLPIPGLLRALHPSEDVSSYYKTNLSNILQSQLLHSPFLACALRVVRMAVSAGEELAMSCRHPEALLGGV